MQVKMSVVKDFPANAGDTGSIPGLRRFPWRRKWQPTPVFLPGKSHGLRSLAGYSPWDHKELDMIEHVYTIICRLNYTVSACDGDETYGNRLIKLEGRQNECLDK